jgi:SAM-dependent methyltransferase
VSPYTFDPRLFERRVDEALTRHTPSRGRALEALDSVDSGPRTVLDVGCGAGAASLPLVPPATAITGVDPESAMLRAFARRADEAGVAHTEIEGRWPDVAATAPVTDVVVCHHVLYNVPGLGDFVTALSEKAARRVVVETTPEHPLAWMTPLWQRIHGVGRPQGPTLDDIVAVLDHAGIRPTVEPFDAPATPRTQDEMVEFVRARLAVGPDRDAEIHTALADLQDAGTRQLVTLWWDTGPAG